MADLMPMIHAERRSLSEFLETLSPEQWSAPTWCDKWNVQQLVGHLVTLAELYKKTGAPLRAKKRLVGLKLTATDVDWSTGEGAEVSGPAMSLILAMVGRAKALDDCTGAGVEELRARA